ncbi:hypothetical protein V3589_32015, partial [Sinorhizobium fredii]
NIKTCVTPPCKSGAKSRVSPQPDSRPRQLSLHQSADNFTVPIRLPLCLHESRTFEKRLLQLGGRLS